jgi:exodeoxyribonuclease VII large subunit
VLEPGTKSRTVWGVSALLQAISESLQTRFSACTVSGEISGFALAGSGHLYFSLKDSDGQTALLKCAMFRRAASLLNFMPADGQKVEVRGRLTLYEQRGELQMVVEALQRIGAGALYERFLQLKAQLQAQGLFDVERKRRLPTFPRTLGVVTSLDAAALHDVIAALTRRSPHVRIVVYPSLVQGAQAPANLIDAITQASQRQEIDALLICRGGGSLEDLWAFNDEGVVRAIAACSMPVITGIGHDSDITLADLASDVHAPTPTAAAELAAPQQQDCLQQLEAIQNVLQRSMQRRLDQAAQRLDAITARLRTPAQRLQSHAQRLHSLQQRLLQARIHFIQRRQSALQTWPQRLSLATQITLQNHHQKLSNLEQRLNSLNPRNVLARGFAWLQNSAGEAVTSVTTLKVGDALRAVLADGEAGVVVTERVKKRKAAARHEKTPGSSQVFSSPSGGLTQSERSGGTRKAKSRV